MIPSPQCIAIIAKVPGIHISEIAQIYILLSPVKDIQNILIPFLHGISDIAMPVVQVSEIDSINTVCLMVGKIEQN